jgi:hypothetical protein
MICHINMVYTNVTAQPVDTQRQPKRIPNAIRSGVPMTVIG